MRAALEEDALDAAVSFYAEAQPLLKRWGGRGTFKQIAAESDAVAKEISVVSVQPRSERTRQAGIAGPCTISRPIAK